MLPGKTENSLKYSPLNMTKSSVTISFVFFFPSLEGKAFYLPTNSVPQNSCFLAVNLIPRIKCSLLMLSAEYQGKNNTSRQSGSFCKRSQNLLVSPYSSLQLHQNIAGFLANVAYLVVSQLTFLGEYKIFFPMKKKVKATKRRSWPGQIHMNCKVISQTSFI